MKPIILFDKDGVFLGSEIINVEAYLFAMKEQGIDLTREDRFEKTEMMEFMAQISYLKNIVLIEMNILY